MQKWTLSSPPAVNNSPAGAAEKKRQTVDDACVGGMLLSVSCASLKHQGAASRQVELPREARPPPQ